MKEIDFLNFFCYRKQGKDEKAILHKACLKCVECSFTLTVTTAQQVSFILSKKKIHLFELKLFRQSKVGEQFYCKKHGKIAQEKLLSEKQSTFDGATDMYAAFGKEYGVAAAEKKERVATGPAGGSEDDER